MQKIECIFYTCQFRAAVLYDNSEVMANGVFVCKLKVAVSRELLQFFISGIQPSWAPDY